MFIVRPDAEKTLVDEIVERVEGLVRQDEGIVLDCEVIGRKRLAYEVKKYHEGIYVKINFEAPATVVDKLKHQMQLSEDVILHLIVRTKAYDLMESVPLSGTKFDNDTDQSEVEPPEDQSAESQPIEHEADIENAEPEDVELVEDEPAGEVDDKSDLDSAEPVGQL